jgi:hypothetical protein
VGVGVRVKVPDERHHVRRQPNDRLAVQPPRVGLANEG